VRDVDKVRKRIEHWRLPGTVHGHGDQVSLFSHFEAADPIPQAEGLRATIVNTLAAMPAQKTNDTTVTDRVKAALILVSLSPDFVIQK